MRAILQRVLNAAVTVDGEVVASIGPGMLVLVGVSVGDEAKNAAQMVDKLTRLRIWSDDRGKMNLDARAAGASFLLVSQFTLSANLDRGRRPSFNTAAPPAVARPLVDAIATGLSERGFSVSTGVFGANMQVSLVNDGPVTFVLDT